MRHALLLLATVVFGASFQAQAVTLKEYAAIRGGYAATKHQTNEQYKSATKPFKNDWNGEAAIASVAYGLKAGYLRAEVEGNATSTTKERRRYYTEGYTLDNINTARINTTSIMFNSYLELPIEFPLKPYIGAGVGMAHIKAKFKNQMGTQSETKNVSGNQFAWQIGAGLAYEITPQWAVDLGYRVMDYGKITKKINGYSSDGQSYNMGKVRLSAKVYNAYLGARYSF